MKSAHVLDVVREEAGFTWFRGYRVSDRRPIIAKKPRTSGPNSNLAIIRGLENEIAIASDLDRDWAVRPIELLLDDGTATLILDDPGGDPLDVRLGSALDMTTFLRIAVSLAEAVRQIHQRGIIHKDIKPANLFVDESDAVRVTGFSIASRLTRERQGFTSTESIAGTFAYMAPEQTGRMNRSVDSRSDLYSMGVTFYQMLTGHLPFAAADAMEWIHCHIARQPQRPEEHTDGIPAAVGDIVMKLLAKSADDRYQSAAGVLADLARCQAAWHSEKRIDAFPLGQNEGLIRLLLPERLYGRESEVTALAEAFGRIADGGFLELILVSGYSGVGKSSVVNELQKTIVAQRGLFCWGKFDQYKRDIPYATLAQALRILVEKLLGQNDDALARWRTRLSDALGQNGQLIINLVPQLELIIGTQPPLLDLSPHDARLRFQAVFGRFIGVFAQAGHPLTLFLDDIHWIDPATLDLLQYLATRHELRHLLLIGAYRDNEVGPNHPLTAALAEITRSNAAVQKLCLVNLTLGDVTRLITDALRCRPNHARSLAQLVHAKTGGNPFFVIQFISSLENEGLLTFVAGTADWAWDIGRIASKGFTDNVVDLMVARLRRLPGHVRHALKQLACMGNGARVTTLAAVHGHSPELLEAALWDGLRLEFVSLSSDRYSFAHDRIQEAAYSLIPQGERAPLHLQIGRGLTRTLSTQEVGEQIFDIVNHYNRAAGLVEARSERRLIGELNLAAGRRAKASTAYTAALQYFVAGDDAVGSDAEARDKLQFDLALERAECEFLTGHHDASRDRLSKLYDRAETAVDRAAVTRLRMTVHTTLDGPDRAVDVGLAFLGDAGFAWSAHPADNDVDLELAAMWQLVGTRPIEDLIDLPLLKDPKLLATIEVLAEFLAPASFTDNNLFYLAVIRMTNLSLQHGNCDASACAYTLLSVVLGLRHDDDAALRFGRLGCDLVDARGLDRFKSKVYTFFGTFVLPWAFAYPQSRPVLRLAVEAATGAGDLTYIAYSLRSLVANLLASGDPLPDVQRELEKALSFMRVARFGFAADSLVAQLALVRKLQGESVDVGVFSDSDENEQGFERRLNQSRARLAVAGARYYIYKLQEYFLEGDLSNALIAAQKASGLVWSTARFLEIVEYHFYSALVLARASEELSEPQRQANLDAIEMHRRQIANWAKSCPQNHSHREALLAAEIAGLRGRELEAMRLYEVAIEYAHDNGFVQNEGIASERAAAFYQARGASTAAQAHLRHARACYARWGAVAKVKQIDALRPNLIEQTPIAAVQTSPTLETLDLAAVMKTSLAVSGEIVLDRLIERIMTVALEHAGADRGLLILADGGGERIEAEARIVDSSVQVDLRGGPVSPTQLCEPVLRYVVRTQKSVLLDDAVASGSFVGDDYVRRTRMRSLTCLPLTKQSRIIGILYLENRLATHVFTPERIVVLSALASQAAISLENARLYSDLETTKARLQASHDEMQMLVSLVENSSDFIGYLPASGRDGYINAGGRRMVGIALDADVSRVQISDLRPADEDERYLAEIVPALARDGRWTGERYLRHFKTNASIPVLQNLFYIIDKTTGKKKGIASICKDISEQRRADEALRKAQSDLEQIAQRMAIGEFAGSIAHELNQPLMAIVSSGETCLLRLQKTPPDIDKARAAAERVVRDGHRASEVIKSIRGLLKKAAPDIAEFNANGAIREVLDLTGTRIRNKGIDLSVSLTAGAIILGDRGQFQQVVLNLVANAIDAVADVTGRERLLRLRTLRADDCLTISVEDSGRGVASSHAGKIYDAFFTTKPEGMGMGLAICRSIVELHGGKLWAEPKLPNGSIFSFTVPVAMDRAPMKGAEDDT
jgi:predicted ATPase/signal transduction histidine kinase